MAKENTTNDNWNENRVISENELHTLSEYIGIEAILNERGYTSAEQFLTETHAVDSNLLNTILKIVSLRIPQIVDANYDTKMRLVFSDSLFGLDHIKWTREFFIDITDGILLYMPPLGGKSTLHHKLQEMFVERFNIIDTDWYNLSGYELGSDIKIDILNKISKHNSILLSNRHSEFNFDINVLSTRRFTYSKIKDYSDFIRGTYFEKLNELYSCQNIGLLINDHIDIVTYDSRIFLYTRAGVLIDHGRPILNANLFTKENVYEVQ